MKILWYGTYVVGFETKLIVDLWGMAFHAMVVIALFLVLLLNSILSHCARGYHSINSAIFCDIESKILTCGTKMFF